MKKIAVFGNCASPVIAGALKEILKDDVVYGFEAAPVIRNGALEAVEKVFSGCDVVFCQDSPTFGNLAYSRQKEIHPRAFRLPSVSFTGFHPDCVYLIAQDKTQYTSPLGPYNSAIVAAAFSRRLSIPETIGLFCEASFGKLGYFDEFAKAKAFLKTELNRSKLDLDDLLVGASFRGPFMHTINHPRGWFLANVARALGLQAKLFAVPQRSELLFDILSFNAIWPVYPEVASRIGFEGDYLFKKPGMPDFTAGTVSYLNLFEFVQGSFNQYSAYPEEVFQLPAVTRASAALSL